MENESKDIRHVSITKAFYARKSLVNGIFDNSK
jgi:hypothetical protein